MVRLGQIKLSEFERGLCPEVCNYGLNMMMTSATEWLPTTQRSVGQGFFILRVLAYHLTDRSETKSGLQEIPTGERSAQGRENLHKLEEAYAQKWLTTG